MKLPPDSIFQTTEDETEAEQPEELARRHCPEYLKVVAQPEARKKSVENEMRLMSGFLVLSMWNLGYLLGTLYMQFVPFMFACFVFTEMRRIKINDDKDKSSKIKVVEWMIFVFSQIVVLPKGSFRREILENSGLSVEKNPLLFEFLYEYQILFITFFSIVIFLTFIIGLKKETVRY